MAFVLYVPCPKEGCPFTSHCFIMTFLTKPNLMRLPYSFVVFFVWLIILHPITAQTTEATFVEGAPNVFLDCRWQCDFDAIRNTIDYVNFVRDPQSADIHVLVTSQGVGSGGDKLTLYFTGLNEYDGITDTISTVTASDDTDKLVNDAIMSAFKEGMLQYLLRSSLKDKIEYSVNIPKQVTEEDLPVDPWNSWVFSLGTGGFFSGESNYNNFNLRGNLRANRVTKESKIRFSAGLNYRESNFYFRDSLNEIIDTSTITSIRRNKYVDASYVKSITDHFSLGVFYSIFQNITNNYRLSNTVVLGAEYNLFKYDESDRNQLTLTYKIGPKHNVYVEKTVFNKKKELVFFHSLDAYLYQKQNWGNVGIGAGYSQYLQDVKLNRLTFNTNVDWKVAKGLTFGLGGYLSFISDQINLPKSQAQIQDVLLRNRLFATNYSLFGFANIRYTFGSKYNNVVNSRFSGGGGNVTYFF